MQHIAASLSSGYSTGASGADCEGMGDVRVFWIAAAVAVLAVVAVVAFKLNGQDVRTTLFGNAPAWILQMVQPAGLAGIDTATSGGDMAVLAQPVGAQTAR